MNQTSRRTGWRVGAGVLGIAALLLGSGVSITQAKEDKELPIPLPGLTGADMTKFEDGRRIFEFEFTPREGLGPVFNARSCMNCHHTPTIGGHGPGYRGNIRFLNGNGTTDGKMFHQRSISGGPAESLPDLATISKRKPPTLLGIGLIDAIPESEILRHVDENDADGDGIRGRAAIGKDGHVMRFGSQAHVGSLQEFVADALRQELGVTSPVPGFEQETSASPLAFPRVATIPGPNVTMDVVRKLVDFIALLAPPSRGPSEFGEAIAARGEKIFHEVACAKCHVPNYRTTTGPFTRKGEKDPVTTSVLLGHDIAPFSDFLLHDMGPTLDDKVSLGVAKTSEYRTPPLWGLRFHKHLLMHDDRAANIEQAIIFHDGEAAGSRKRFLALPAEDRRALVGFLETL